jgi:hypothetical protein
MAAVREGGGRSDIAEEHVRMWWTCVCASTSDSSSESQDEDSMLMFLVNSQDVNSMSMCV